MALKIGVLPHDLASEPPACGVIEASALRTGLPTIETFSAALVTPTPLHIPQWGRLVL